jgi:hypothetical protein
VNGMRDEVGDGRDELDMGKQLCIVCEGDDKVLRYALNLDITYSV